GRKNAAGAIVACFRTHEDPLAAGRFSSTLHVIRSRDGDAGDRGQSTTAAHARAKGRLVKALGAFHEGDAQQFWSGSQIESEFQRTGGGSAAFSGSASRSLGGVRPDSRAIDTRAID